ncbi:short-chain dehydrogenase [Azoarcus olearius]|uniref:SDR family NAD(P)-dependent oxidoreductase n=1 Tax=Azoarcus sp. (strain BH72) TaxID=418699 RepID=UPI00080622CA|nr:SDR family NAD(P)-dependent oxidoreductase [Azoarcus olearius]ANQ86474.1 short-chain dehydrogenase [Azoarcus olearius]
MIGRPLNPPLTDWRGRRVWLVGASTGIGAALARALAARGAQLALSARHPDKLAEAAAACPDALLLPLDLSHENQFAAVHQRLLAQWGAIDVVMFVAGTYRPLRAWELDAAAVYETMAVNLTGTLCGVATVLPPMLARGAGSIVLVASVAGYRGLPRALLYGSSKAALINFAETLYLDLAPRGLGVYLVDPGFVATPLTAANDFRMPALIDADTAAREILTGMARGEFEIHFPKRFTRVMKALALLPRRCYFPLIRRITGV